MAPLTRDDAIVELATELGRWRPLTEREIGIVERAIGQQRTTTRPWLPKDDKALRTLKLKGLRAPEIAKELGRTPWAVYRRISDLKAKNRGR